MQSSKQQPEDTLLPPKPSVARLSLPRTSNPCVVIMHMPTQTNVYPVFLLALCIVPDAILSVSQTYKTEIRLQSPPVSN